MGIKNIFIGGIVAALGLVSFGALEAKADQWYVVVENDASFVNKDVTDTGLSAGGLGYASWLGDKAVISAELTTGGMYSSDEFKHIVKGAVELNALLDDKGKNSFTVSVDNVYDTEDGYNVTTVESKFRFGL